MNEQQSYTDINIPPWLQALPKEIWPFALLMRLDRPIGAWLLFLPGLASIVLASDGLSGLDFNGFLTIILFAIGAILMRGAGCIINDLWDRKLDQQVERTAQRPLASGAISVKTALALLFFLLISSFAILLQFDALTIALGLLSVVFVVVYPYMKRITWWPQAFLGLTFNFGALMGWSAVTGGLAVPALLLYIGGIFWTLGYDTIYAAQDTDDDALIGIRSTALLFGDRSPRMVQRFYFAAIFFWALALSASASMIAMALILFPACHMFWQMGRWKHDDRALSLMLFKSNRDTGLLMSLACAGAAFLA
jgi:4-hydroxybenzoate polyprenyltransferase